MRSTKRTDRSASAGSGEDQTRQAVPTPSRSVTWTSARLLAVGKTPMEVGWDQALPDWLKHTCTPQLNPEGVPAVAVGISRATGEPGTSGTLQRVLGFRRVDAGDPGRGQRLDGPGRLRRLIAISSHGLGPCGIGAALGRRADQGTAY